MRALAFFLVFLSSFPRTGFAADGSKQSIELKISSGTPLRVYLTKKISIRAGASVEAKLLLPLYAFDRQVVPEGTTVLGRVSRIESVSKWQRTQAILGGDFTPLHFAFVEFTTLVMPGGMNLPIQTVETRGLASIYTPPRPPKQTKKQKKAHAKNSNGGVLGIGKQTAQNQINARVNGRTHGLAELVRGPNKKERIVDFLMAKLPYHPQWIRRGTRFDVELKESLAFGAEPVQSGALALLGSQPGPDSIVHARLITALDSASAKAGQPVEAVIAEPLFSSAHQLILPAGTRIQGAVVVARRALWFHRGGRLRFNFQNYELPDEATRLKPSRPAPAPAATQAVLAAAEQTGKTKAKVDSEGGVQATESKTRLLAPILAAIIANKAADNDAGRAAGGQSESNVAGRTLGGGSGLGVFGAAVAQSSKYVGTALGFYGMAWSVYANVIARGGEVQFPRNAAIEIKFGARPPQGSKFAADGGITEIKAASAAFPAH
jgi:hypothetical protein